MTSRSSCSSTISRNTSRSGSRPTTCQRPFGCDLHDSACSSACRRSAKGTRRSSIAAQGSGFCASLPIPSPAGRYAKTRHFVKYRGYVDNFSGQDLDKVDDDRPERPRGADGQDMVRITKFGRQPRSRPSGSQDNAQRRWPHRLSTDGAEGNWLRGQDLNLRPSGYEGDFTQPADGRRSLCFQSSRVVSSSAKSTEVHAGIRKSPPVWTRSGQSFREPFQTATSPWQRGRRGGLPLPTRGGRVRAGVRRTPAPGPRQAADLAEIPAMVRTVTDREALEVQVIETYSG